MSTDFFREYSQKLSLSQKTHSTVSTLLIPKKLFRKMKSKLGTQKFPNIFRLLLNRYRGSLTKGNLSLSSRTKTKFQDSGLDLVKFKFRPDDADWVELGILASSAGVSRCLLFVFILELELRPLEGLSVERDVVATLSIPLIRFVWQLSEDRSEIERKLQCREKKKRKKTV
jgi:hypothetical protein